MRRDSPLSIISRWLIVSAALLLHPALLYLLLPVFGEPANWLSALAPVLAAFLIDWRVGLGAVVVNLTVSAQVFRALTDMQRSEGIPKAVALGFVLALMCLGADRLRRYIEERKSIVQELRQAKKMDAVGRLAGGVAHDINNILSSIMASVYAHRQELGQNGREFQDLDNIATACDRGAQLIRNLLGYSRNRSFRREVTALNDVVEAVHSLLKRTVNKNIHMVVRQDPEGPAILADRAEIESALMNLCINAIDAMPNGGTLTVSTRREGRLVFLCVEDTGIGMDASVKERIFEPFFTTKGEGKGTGLGLSMVYGAVKAMSGRIVLDSAPGKGTSIRLIFPRVTTQGSPLRSETPLPQSSDPRSLVGRTVLLIDDEPLVLRSGVRLLRALGCQVLSAANGSEGLALAREQKAALDLVIVDLIMPDMDGFAVIEEIRRISPSIPVILSSGYTRETDRLDATRQRFGRVRYLAKPFHSEELVNTAVTLLNATGEGESPDTRGKGESSDAAGT